MRLFTVDDALSTLSHSSLPSLVVEGGSDVIVLRRLEQMVSGVELSVFPVGGRDTVLGIFDRRAELQGVKCVLFFVDSDLWIYSTVPAQYGHNDILTSNGYSIENDMYEDGNLERLLTNGEKVAFQSELDHFLDWFTNQVRLGLDGQEFELSSHPTKIVGEARPTVADTALRAQIAGDYHRLLRGRSLFQILIRQLSHPGRASKYSFDNLLELGAIAGGPNLVRVRDWIMERFAAHGCLGQSTA